MDESGSLVRLAAEQPALATVHVEVLSFAGCPHVRAAVALVEQVARATAVDVDLRLIDVPDGAAAVERRFLAKEEQ
jgi:hypothetical protein